MNTGAKVWVMDHAVTNVGSAIPMPDYMLDAVGTRQTMASRRRWSRRATSMSAIKAPIDGMVLSDHTALRFAARRLRHVCASLRPGRRAGYAVFLLQGGVGAGVARERYNPAPGAVPTASTPFSLFTVSANVSYPLDI
jgi:hypothetical protein